MNKDFAIRLHKDREEIVRFCGSFKNIYLFGTGFIASQLYEYLAEENIEIKGVIVTEKHDEMFNGLQVQALSEANLTPEDGIILAVNSTNQSVIEKALLVSVDIKQIYHQMIYSVSSCPSIMCDGLIGRQLSDSPSPNGFFAECHTLNELGNKYHTDKSDSFHNYLSKYEFFLKDWKDKVFNLLELGVLNGDSLRVWEEYFENASIYGVDINPECIKEESDRIHIFIKDLSVIANYEELGKIKPSIIIDDGSHMWSHQLKSLFYMFDVLPSGGIFIMEDLETSFPAYRSYYYMDAAVCTYDVLASISGIVCSNEVLRKENTSAALWDLHEEIEQIASEVEMISFIHGSCIIIKK